MTLCWRNDCNELVVVIGFALLRQGLIKAYNKPGHLTKGSWCLTLSSIIMASENKWRYSSGSLMDPCGGLMALQIILLQISLKTKMRRRTRVDGPLDGVMVSTRVQLTGALTDTFKDQCLAHSLVRQCRAARHLYAPVRRVKPHKHSQTTQNIFCPFRSASLPLSMPIYWLVQKPCF